MDSNSDQSASEKMDLTDFLKVREENFQRLMWNRASIREKYEHDIKLLEMERDAKLQENYALLHQLGMPEDQLPLPPENEEIKKSRLAEGFLRKLSETEIKRVLREMMESKKFYIANQLIGFLQISYKDFSEFYQKHGHDEDDENPPDVQNPPFLLGKGQYKWRKYRLWEPTDPNP
jgi:hypothetical protein